MKALLLIAHGSRKQESTDEVAQLAKKVQQAQHGFDLVTHCFLELAEPKMPQAIQKLVQQGATQVRVLPYFLAAGYHVAEDLPQLVEQARQDYPDIEFDLLTHIGAADLMPQWVIQMSE